MKIKHVKAAEITLDSGDTVLVEHLGAGQFHKCFVDRSKSEVYSITIDRGNIEDCSKEVISQCSENAHIPSVEYVGAIGNSRVYKMPLYFKMEAKKHTHAWKTLKQLIEARNAAYSGVINGRHNCPAHALGNEINGSTIEHLEAMNADPGVIEALEEINSWASNYGQSYVFEFSKRNVMVDADGNLILLDVLFNMEAVEKIRRRS